MSADAGGAAVPDVLDAAGTALNTWRAATAARVFALAAGLGLLASTGELPAATTPFLTLCVLAAVFSVPVRSPAARQWGPVGESALAALLFASLDRLVDPLLIYLAVPPLAAGLFAGVGFALTSVAAQVLAVGAASVAGRDGALLATFLAEAAPWVLAGLGLGLLAAWWRASALRVDSQHERYRSAHQLLGHLHELARGLASGLDTQSLAGQLLTMALARTGADAGVVLLRDGDSGLLEVGSTGGAAAQLRAVADPSRLATWLDEECVTPHLVNLPLRVGARPVGVLVLGARLPLKDEALALCRAELEPHSLRLDTAHRFDEVRRIATSEERHRLAREIHDGIAQELSGIGYLVDDLAATAMEPEQQATALQLRAELSRVVEELRLSIFDLRSGVHAHGGLGLALSDYVREVGTRTPLTVHLSLDESTRRLHPDVEAELFRIAQEAVNNARRHAGAHHLWVTLQVDGNGAQLQVADDGMGAAAPRVDGYGLSIMRERAERIGAVLDVGDRPGGGTAVTVTVTSRSPTVSGGGHGAHRAARR